MRAQKRNYYGARGSRKDRVSGSLGFRVWGIGRKTGSFFLLLDYIP